MDEETIDLIRQLLVRAAIAIEDICDVGTTSLLERADMVAAARSMKQALDQSRRMIEAAEALLSF